MSILALINTLVFALLGGIHIYWVLGGIWGMNAAVPTNEKGIKTFQPSKLGTLVVAVGLWLFGWINLTYTGWISTELDAAYLKYAVFFIAVIFALRCFGDFRYVGFSKRFKESYFAQMDSKYFSPLCLFLAVSHGLLFFI